MSGMGAIGRLPPMTTGGPPTPVGGGGSTTSLDPKAELGAPNVTTSVGTGKETVLTGLARKAADIHISHNSGGSTIGRFMAKLSLVAGMASAEGITAGLKMAHYLSTSKNLDGVVDKCLEFGGVPQETRATTSQQIKQQQLQAKMNKVEQRIIDKQLDLVALKKQSTLLDNYNQKRPKQVMDGYELSELKESTKNQITALESEIGKLREKAGKIQEQDSSITLNEGNISNQVAQGTTGRQNAVQLEWNNSTTFSSGACLGLSGAQLGAGALMEFVSLF